MISIIIPVYNQANKLSRCLDSIIKQTYKDYEIIIVNDGSNDNFEEVFKNYKKNFQLINQENRGSNPARNRGFRESKGEYIIFCDADVTMKPEMLQEMLNALEKNKEAGYAYSSFKYGLKTFKLWPWTADKLKKMPYITTTSLIRREVFPGFDENIKRLQDWDLWLTILEEGHPGIWINKILFKVHSGGTISSWFPKIFFKLPFKPKKIKNEIEKYNKALDIIKNKHGI